MTEKQLRALSKKHLLMIIRDLEKELDLEKSAKNRLVQNYEEEITIVKSEKDRALKDIEAVRLNEEVFKQKLYHEFEKAVQNEKNLRNQIVLAYRAGSRVSLNSQADENPNQETNLKITTQT